MMLNDPKTLLFALLGGIVPSLLWLWFWLKEERTEKEPKKIITAVFILGMISVIFVIPLQKFIQANVLDANTELALWAGVEEIIKYLVVVIILWNTRFIDRPIDWPIYLITSALGFAALENTMFLLKPFSVGETTVGLLTGSLRFLGSTLLHSIASAIIGILLGLSFHLNSFFRKIYLIIGIILATALHTVFNFFIINNKGSDFISVFAFLWVVTIIIMLLFEKLRRMSGEN
ncbi:MAG: PrsW family glutamic-type intramembrane protease [Candidatus Paceibacterota bacterium]